MADMRQQWDTQSSGEKGGILGHEQPQAWGSLGRLLSQPPPGRASSPGPPYPLLRRETQQRLLPLAWVCLFPMWGWGLLSRLPRVVPVGSPPTQAEGIRTAPTSCSSHSGSLGPGLQAPERAFEHLS